MLPHDGARRNQLLRAMRPEAYARLAPKLRCETLAAKDIIYRPNQPIERVHFPETAVICLMAVMENGDTLETSTVGREGASWVSASVGALSMPCETIVAVGGETLSLAIGDLDEEMRQNEQFRDLLTQYSHALLIHSLKMTSCTGLHSLSQRCARWMLTTLDRVSENRFSVTHEFLAMLLGSRRPSVTLVLDEFKAQGLIHIQRGQVLVADRRGLEQASCECYEVIKENYAQVGR